MRIIEDGKVSYIDTQDLSEEQWAGVEKGFLDTPWPDKTIDLTEIKKIIGGKNIEEVALKLINYFKNKYGFVESAV